MNKEEIEERIKYAKSDFTDGIEILLEIIEKLEQENNKQNKIIDEMAKELEELKLWRFKREDGGELLGKYRCYNKQDWKQYFEKKVEEK